MEREPFPVYGGVYNGSAGSIAHFLDMSQDLLTLERMRADIARMVHEQPEDIALDDNLMDLGLDSMRVLNLLVTWNETGIGLDFSEIAEHTTLQGWWEVVERRLAQRNA